MSDSGRRRARFRPNDPSHWNAGKLGWAFPPGTYDPESGIDDGDSWTFEPDDEDELPNFASLEDLEFAPEPSDGPSGDTRA